MAKNNGLQPRERDLASRQKIEVANRNKEQVREYFNNARINIDYSLSNMTARARPSLLRADYKAKARLFVL